MAHRVVVTGIGVYTSIGSNVRTFWENCLDGFTYIQKIPQHWRYFAEYKSDIWSPLPDIDVELNALGRVDRLHYDPVTLIAFLAARDALTSAGFSLTEVNKLGRKYEIEGINPVRTGVFIGTGLGGGSSFLSNFSNHVMGRSHKKIIGISEIVTEHEAKKELTEIANQMYFPTRFSPFAVSMLMQNAVSAGLGVKFSLKGPNVTYSVACASGTVAIGNAFQAIKNGLVDVAITGGSEYVVDDYGAMFRGYDIAGTLVHDYENPESANRPFDKGHSGFLYSQGGAGVLVLENYDSAIRRGAVILAEIIGFEQSFDARSMMSIEKEGSQIERMILALVKNANLKVNDINYINTHGTGTKNNDQVESDVMQRLFDKHAWVNSTKSLLGHTLGASGSIEAVVTILTLVNQVTHICKNLQDPISDLNFVRNLSQQVDVRFGMSQSFAFGGHNAALLFSRFE